MPYNLYTAHVTYEVLGVIRKVKGTDVFVWAENYSDAHEKIRDELFRVNADPVWLLSVGNIRKIEGEIGEIQEET